MEDSIHITKKYTHTLIFKKGQNSQNKTRTVKQLAARFSRGIPREQKIEALRGRKPLGSQKVHNLKRF